MKSIVKLALFTIATVFVAIAGYNAYTGKQVNPLSDLGLANVEALAMYEGDGNIDPNKAYGYKLTNCYDTSSPGGTKIIGATCTSDMDRKASCSYSSAWGKCK